MERQEELKKRESGLTKSSADSRIHSHFDQSTLKLKPRSKESTLHLSEALLKNFFSEYGIIDGVICGGDGRASYVMFRYRDSALKALHAIKEESI